MNLSDVSYLENGDENVNHSLCSRKQTEMFLIRLLSASAFSSVKCSIWMSFLWRCLELVIRQPDLCKIN